MRTGHSDKFLYKLFRVVVSFEGTGDIILERFYLSKCLRIAKRYRTTNNLLHMSSLFTMSHSDLDY